MSASQVRKLREERKKQGGGKDRWFKMKPGTYILRVGPPWKKNGEVWKEAFFHGRYKNQVYCGKNDVDKETGKRRRCLVCRRLKELKKEKRTAVSKKLYGLLVQKVEGLWNVLEAKKLESGKLILRKPKQFKILRFSSKWHNLLLDIFSEEEYRRKSILGVASPKYGRYLKVRRTGEEKDTEYSFMPMPESSSLSKDGDERKKIIGTLHDLDELVHGSSQEELEAFLRKAAKLAKNAAEAEEEEDESNGDDYEEEEESDEDEEEEERPRKKKKKSKKSKDEDEEDEEDEDEEEEDDDDDEDAEEAYREMKKHHAKKKKKKKKEEEDDDDEEEEDADEEDEEDEED